MAATAYAFLVSLLNTMDQIQIHPRLSPCFYNFQFESLRAKVDFLVKFVENHSDAIIPEEVDLLVDADRSEGEELLSRIAVAAQKAEDIIEVEAAVRIRDGSTEVSPFFTLYLQKIIRDVDSIMKEEAIQVKEETRRFQDEQPTSTSPMALQLSSIAKTIDSKMVGFDGYLEKLLDELTGHHSSRRIIPVVGMGGIGKTTLIRNVYENSLIVYHFDVRVWVTVSQSFSVRNILLQALSSLGGSTGTTDDGVGKELYQILSGQRYLVVLDDVWSAEVWQEINCFFPENYSGSRIVVTTRQIELVDYFASSAVALDFLDDNNGWDLFCSKAFPEEDCPPELEKVGKNILKKCKGLPLAIIVIGGLLGKSPRTKKYWEKISRDKSLVLEYSGEGNTPLCILYLSYRHLPVWLKSCFLYMGLYPEDHAIDVSELIQLWVAEGFIKPKRNQSLEEVGESYIKELVDRNLLLVSGLSLNKSLKTGYLHDLVRELCMRIAEKEKFYCVQRDIDGIRHFIVDETSASWFYTGESMTTSERPSLTNPMVYYGRRETTPFKSRLLRVIVDDESILDLTFQQVNMRFFFHKYNSSPEYGDSLPPSISMCWSLQTLIFQSRNSISLPPEIWKMPHLRHINMWPRCHLAPPPRRDNVVVLQNLQTLKSVTSLDFSEEICKRIPNIKELRIQFNGSTSHFNLQNVESLSKLELLDYSAGAFGYRTLHNLKLPSSLKDLTLQYCILTRSDKSMIASLPHLQILKFVGDEVVGKEWDCVEDEFLGLKHLCVRYCSSLKNWIGESSSFPVLESLSLEGLSYLEEIPSGIGEISTLENINLYHCSESAIMSAVKILEEHESLGNQSLRLRLEFSRKTEAETWKKKIKDSGFTSQNLQISGIL